MSTYSVYNIHIDNNLSFTPGATAGSVLAIDANGSTSWVPQSGSGGSQTLEQVLIQGNNAGTYSIQGSEWKIENFSNIDPDRPGVFISNSNSYPYILMATSSSVFALAGNINLGGNVEISEQLRVIGLTGPSLVAVDSNGVLTATSSTGGGSQTLEQTLALGNDVGTYSIVSAAGQQLNINAGEGGSVRIDGGASANYIGVGYGSIVLSGTSSFSGDVVLPITSSFLATDSDGKIIATASPGGGSALGSFGITIDGGGSAITTGVKGYVQVPYSGTITGWTLLADVSGSIVIDVWKDIYANFPPLVGDSIAGSEKPTLSSQQINEDNTLSTWTTSVSAGDIIAFNVDSASTLTRVNLAINITKS